MPHSSITIARPQNQCYPYEILWSGSLLPPPPWCHVPQVHHTAISGALPTELGKMRSLDTIRVHR